MSAVNCLLKKAADLNPNKVALITKEGEFTYSWLNRMADRVATNLIQQCLTKPGDRIALMLPNGVDFVVTYYAILKTGAVVVPIYGQLKSKELKYILNHMETRILITSSTYLPEVERALENDSGIEYCIVNGETTTKYLNLADFYKENCVKDLIKGNFNSEEDVAVIFYTSGTQGIPKGVITTHSNIVSKMDPLRKATTINSEDRILCGLPLVYVYGQIMALNLSIWCNSTLILLEEESIKDICKALEHHSATLMMSIPTTYYLLTSQGDERETRSIKNLRFAITGGSTISTHFKELFESKFNIQLLDSYGLTETTSSVVMERYGELQKPGSIGRPIPDHRVCIFDEMGFEVGPGEIGEIVIRSESLMKGYLKDERAQHQILKNGWLFTGDMGYQDVDGNFFIVDRRKDIIQTSGFVVSPREVEEVLSEHPFIIDTAVVGVPNLEKGAIIKAYIVLKPGSHISEIELQTFVKKYLADFKVPHEIEIVNELPRSNSGKLLKRLLV